jgi:hypothetical protein
LRKIDQPPAHDTVDRRDAEFIVISQSRIVVFLRLLYIAPRQIDVGVVGLKSLCLVQIVRGLRVLVQPKESELSYNSVRPLSATSRLATWRC